MSAGERLMETPAGVKLAPLSVIEDGKARNFVLDVKGRYFHGFVVRRGDAVFGYVDSCPHAGVPLAQKLDQYVSSQHDHIECSWHGALFRVEDGFCVAGPCRAQSLKAWPVAVEDGMIVTR